MCSELSEWMWGEMIIRNVSVPQKFSSLKIWRTTFVKIRIFYQLARFEVLVHEVKLLENLAQQIFPNNQFYVCPL